MAVVLSSFLLISPIPFLMIRCSSIEQWSSKLRSFSYVACIMWTYQRIIPYCSHLFQLQINLYLHSISCDSSLCLRTYVQIILCIRLDFYSLLKLNNAVNCLYYAILNPFCYHFMLHIELRALELIHILELFEMVRNLLHTNIAIDWNN